MITADVRPLEPGTAREPDEDGFGAFMGLILVRTRIGLIYEVAKLNSRPGLPADRVKRGNPLSIYFLMLLLVGASAGMTIALVVSSAGLHSKQAADEVVLAAGPSNDPSLALLVGGVVGVAYRLAFLLLCYGGILHATTESKLQGART